MEITLSTVTFTDWKDIIDKAKEQAKRGDSQARKFLADYLLGPPQQRVDITTKGKQLTSGISDEQHARAIATLYDALRTAVGGGDSGGPDAVGAAERPAVAGATEPGG